MVLLYALGAAVVYGSGDFLGGVATRRHGVVRVVAITHLIGLAMIVVVAPLVGGTVTANDVVWGAIGGVVGGIALAAFYKGLAMGSMTVVAPVTSVVNALVPLGFGLATGERPGSLALVGVAAAVAAVALVSAEPSDPAAPNRHRPGIDRRALGAALVAGIGFGSFFLCLDQTGDGSGLWPLVATRVVSAGLFWALLLGQERRPSVRAHIDRAVLGAGLADQVANVLFLASTRQGMLSVVAVITSLYPAMTVILARAVLGEQLRRAQWVGLSIAAVAVSLIAVA